MFKWEYWSLSFLILEAAKSAKDPGTVGKGIAIEAQRVTKNMKETTSRHTAMRLLVLLVLKEYKDGMSTHHLVWYTIKYLYCAIVRDLTWGSFMVKTSSGGGRGGRGTAHNVT